MANVRPSAFEHAPTSTLVFLRSSGLQILRDGEVVKRRSSTSLSRTGASCFLSGNEFYDLVSDKFPQPAAIVAGGGQLLPGDRLLRWCPNDKHAYVDPDGLRYVGLVSIDLPSSAAGIVWQPPEPMPFLDTATLQLADDGETWVLLGGRSLLLGRGTQGLLVHEDTEPLERLTFDLPRNRVIISLSRARHGLLALPINSEDPLASARWVDEPDAMAVVSPLIPAEEEGELLGVVRFASEDGRDSFYEVWRFGEDLHPIARFEGFPRRRSAEDEQLLLRLEDGSILWKLETERAFLRPGPLLGYFETDAIRLVDPWLQGHVPHASLLADWMHGEAVDLQLESLDTSDREILARYLLESLSDAVDEEYVRLFEQLLATDPQVFAPHADWITTWSDTRLKRLAHAVPGSYWRTTRNAAPDAVWGLVRRLQTMRPGGREVNETRPLTPEAQRIIMLLVGVDTEDSLRRLGPLINDDLPIQVFCRQALIDAWDRGRPAVRRFSYDRMAIVARPLGPDEVVEADPKLGVLKFRRLTENELDRPAFRPTDKLPQISLLSIDLSLAPGALVSRRPVHEFLYFGSQYYGDPSDTWERFEELSRRRFEIKLQPIDAPIEPPFISIGSLGGRPEWLAESSVPYCLHCGMTMFYIGVVHASALLEDFHNENVYSFHCDYCGLFDNVPQ